MMLLATVCLLLFVSHARAQGCAEILISDLGSTDTAGTGGTIAQLFGDGESGNSPDVLVTSSRTVCLAAAETRGNYRFASVIATYDCGGPAAAACPLGPYPRTDQFEFGCVGSVWGDSTFLVNDRNDPVNPSITTLRRDCSFCISPDDATNIGVLGPVDTETHCAACHPLCLTGAEGLGYCTTLVATGCCNVYQPMDGVSMCAVNCDEGFEADPPLFLCTFPTNSSGTHISAETALSTTPVIEPSSISTSISSSLPTLIFSSSVAPFTTTTVSSSVLVLITVGNLTVSSIASSTVSSFPANQIPSPISSPLLTSPISSNATSFLPIPTNSFDASSSFAVRMMSSIASSVVPAPSFIASSTSTLPAPANTSAAASSLPGTTIFAVVSSSVPTPTKSSVASTSRPAQSMSSIASSSLPAQPISSIASSTLPALSISSVASSSLPTMSSVVISSLPVPKMSSVASSSLPAQSMSSIASTTLPAQPISSVASSSLPIPTISSVASSSLPAPTMSSLAFTFLPAPSISFVASSSLPTPTISSVASSSLPAQSISSVTSSSLPTPLVSSVASSSIPTPTISVASSSLPAQLMSSVASSSLPAQSMSSVASSSLPTPSMSSTTFGSFSVQSISSVVSSVASVALLAPTMSSITLSSFLVSPILSSTPSSRMSSSAPSTFPTATVSLSPMDTSSSSIASLSPMVSSLPSVVATTSRSAPVLALSSVEITTAITPPLSFEALTTSISPIATSSLLLPTLSFITSSLATSGVSSDVSTLAVITPTPTPTQVPAATPENVQATTTSSTTIMVTWEDVPSIHQNGIIIDYEVQFEPLHFTEELMIDTINTTNLSANITGLEEHVEYNISVRAYNSVGPGPYSDPVTERTLEDEPAAAPENVQATAISSTRIMVTWEEVPAISQNGIIVNYDVRVEPLQFTGELETQTINTTNLSVNVTGLEENVEYIISVRAYTSVGPGPYSDPVAERTSEDVPEGDRTSSAFLRFSVVNLTTFAEIAQSETINTEISLLQLAQSILDTAASLSVTRIVFSSCRSVTDRPTDVVNFWLRVECNITETPASDTTLEFVTMIADTLPTHFIGVNGILIIPSLIVSEFGFCDYEVSITIRGNYTWPETTGGNEVELECQLGPAVGVAPDEAIGRRRCNTSEWEDPQLEDCITMVALQLQQLEEELTEENVGEVNQNLREIIDEAGEEDQTVENLQVVASVFTTTAALLSEPTIPVEEDTVNNIVEVLDNIQVWPEEVVEDMGSDIVEVFEEIVTGLVEQENFTNLTFVGDDLIFTAERVEVEILTVAGRGFSSSRNENGTLGTTSGNVGDEEERLAPEEIATAFLSPSLFEQFESDEGSREVGIFFSLYESSSLFPIARESDSPTTAESEEDGGIMSQVGSPVVAATVSAGGRTEFPNLTDPVIVVLSLNPVLEGNITRRTCVSYNFNLADGIGNWTSEGCETNISEDDPNIVTCSCNHLTNFACLVDICTRTEGCELTSTARVVLEVLSIIGVVLSLVGIVLTITTLLIFKKLRKRDVTKFHIQLCIAILCMLLVFMIGIDRVPPKNLYGGCVAVSALIHYFTLAAVMWMGAEALLMFQKLVIVFIQITTKYIIIVSIVCWVVPIIPVVISLGIDRDFMVNRDSANDVTFCFIGDRRVFFGAFLGPILAVLLFNLVMMIVVVTVLVRHMRNTMDRMKEQTKQKTILRLLISITGIMSLFGLTWIFGALTISGASLPFQILFVVFNGFQGFFIFLFLCVFSTDARKLWKESLSSSYNKFSTLQRSHKGPGTSTISAGGTKTPKAAAGAFALTSLSDRKSEQPILSVTSDHKVCSDSEDETSMLDGDNLIIKGDGIILLCIANPRATDSPEIQPGEVQRPVLQGGGSSTLGSSNEVNEVGVESSSGGADAEISDNPEEEVV